MSVLQFPKRLKIVRLALNDWPEPNLFIQIRYFWNRYAGKHPFLSQNQCKKFSHDRVINKPCMQQYMQCSAIFMAAFCTAFLTQMNELGFMPRLLWEHAPCQAAWSDVIIFRMKHAPDAS